MVKPTRSRKSVARPKEIWRVEGIGRRGAILYVKVIGSPGAWRIVGLDGLRLDVAGRTVEEAVRRAGRRIPFKAIVFRQISPEA